ncbi:MAG: class I SAM-dependent methyltransferase [Ottowia sp.]|nr:class I SAM-dependent methyltransferase [Ottowia sp.]MBP9953868.1 class I SAM-dependent methyltransferase [Ottowia sp.]
MVATKGYARLLRRLPGLLTGGGHALLCLNASEFPMTFLHDLVREHAAALRFVERVAHPAVFADVDEGKGGEGGGVAVDRSAGRSRFIRKWASKACPRSATSYQ